MRVALVSDQLHRPAAELAAGILARGADRVRTTEFEALRYGELDSDSSWDLVLLMGYDSLPRLVKARCPRSLVGVIDPRPRQKLDLAGVDLLLPNGLESWQQWRSHGLPQALFFLTETAADVAIATKALKGAPTSICFGYLGNSVHLSRLQEVAEKTLRQLKGQVEVRFSLFVSKNVRSRDWGWLPVPPTVFHLETSRLEDFMTTVDVGLVPQLRPSNSVDTIVRLVRRLGKDRGNVVDLSFKPTTNPGRLLTFAQFQKPVIVDSTPSVNQLIPDRYKAYVAFDRNSWAHAITHSISDLSDRNGFGLFLGGVFREVASPEVQLNRIVDAVNGIRAGKDGGTS